MNKENKKDEKVWKTAMKFGIGTFSLATLTGGAVAPDEPSLVGDLTVLGFTAPVVAVAMWVGKDYGKWFDDRYKRHIPEVELLNGQMREAKRYARSARVSEIWKDFSDGRVRHWETRTERILNKPEAGRVASKWRRHRVEKGNMKIGNWKASAESSAGTAAGKRTDAKETFRSAHRTRQLVKGLPPEELPRHPKLRRELRLAPLKD